MPTKGPLTDTERADLYKRHFGDHIGGQWICPVCSAVDLEGNMVEAPCQVTRLLDCNTALEADVRSFVRWLRNLPPRKSVVPLD